MDPISFELPKIGKVTMIGTGPWKVTTYNEHARIIVDANGREANPTVQAKFRPAANTVFAKQADAVAVVEKANELLAAQSA